MISKLCERGPQQRRDRNMTTCITNPAVAEFTAKVFIEFLWCLTRSAGRRVCLIMNQQPYTNQLGLTSGFRNTESKSA